MNRALADIEIAQRNYERQAERLTVGVAFVHGWSMSAHNAQKAAHTAQGTYPFCRVTVTAEIAARVHATRAKVEVG